MGIPGILKEIGKGERIALAKLAVDHLEKSKRPLRIAIDAAIWNFQNQAGQGGKNPALRTLFYRLLKLLALPIHPVFVYDGTRKPLTKRGKTVSRYGTCLPNESSKKLIQAFSFPHHTAPGEAEAECAMMQRNGVVDAVMSQDVDAIMFGSTMTLRDWSKEATKHNKTPTHVSLVDLPRLQERTKLDPEGMMLVAMLSGGDYDDGVSGFGPSLACEVARAGFGSDLLELVRNRDDKGIQEWRDRLQYELETNESGHFKKKHKTVKVPSNFPNRKILDFYMNPAVTNTDDLTKLESRWEAVWSTEIDVPALRHYAGSTFDWQYKPGAFKFVRVMAPALLANRLYRQSCSNVKSVDQISERRKDFSSDGIPELRVSMVSAEVVGLDLDAEEDSPDYLESLAAEEEAVADRSTSIVDENENISLSPSKRRKPSPWTPWTTEKIWIAESIVEIGAPEHVKEWRRIQYEIANDPKKFASRKCPKAKEPKAKKIGGMQVGALLSYIDVSKPRPNHAKEAEAPEMESAALRAPKTMATEHALTSSSTNASRSPNIKDFFRASKANPRGQAGNGLVDPFVDEPVKRYIPAASNGGNYSNVQDEQNSRKKSSVQTTVTPKTWRSTKVATSIPTQDPIVISSSPAPPNDTVGEAGNQIESTYRNVERGKKSPRKDLAISPESDPIRMRRPVADFFAPHIAASRSDHLEADLPDYKSRPDVMNPVSTTGLRTKLFVRHTTAVPRESLPGTWKEIDNVSFDPLQSNTTKRPPRVSEVNLTGD